MLVDFCTKYLDSLKKEGTKNWGRSQVWLLFILLTVGPFAANLSEPRTFVYEGYSETSSAVLYFAAFIATAIFLSLHVSLKSPPRWWRFAVGGISLVAILLGGHSALWLLPLGLLTVSGALAFVRNEEGRFAGFADRTLFVAGCAAMIPLSDLVYEQILTGVNAGPWLISWLGTILSPFTGFRSEGMLTGVVSGQTVSTQFGFDRFGGIHFLSLLFLVPMVSGLKGRSFRDTALDGVVTLLYGPVIGFYLFLKSSGNVDHLWFNEWPWAIAYAPLAIYLAYRLSSPVTSLGKRESGPIPVFALAGCLCLVAGFTLWGPSSEKRGRIVIDEAHGDWETTRVPLNTKTFGSYTTYNYRNLYEELHRIHGAEITEKELDRGSLSDVSVLILKTPTKPYSDEYVDAIVEFVRRGGGLWLVGDHTDAFGMSTYLNKVANRLGVEFRKNAWFEPPVKRNLWAPNSFTDPVARDLDTFLFYTGCELQVSPLDRKLMVARRNLIEDADYAAGSFFGPLLISPENKGGNVSMAALGQRGSGRIALWSDSTLFSNFAIYSPGKTEILLNTVEWLRRDNRFPLFRHILIGLGLLLFTVGVWKTRPSTLGLMAFASFALVPVLHGVNRNGTKIWTPDECLSGRLVAYYYPEKAPHYPVYVSVDRAAPEHYLSSYVAAQRVGARPYIAKTANAASRAETIVTVPIPKPLPKAETEALVKWTREGGTLLVLDGGNDSGRFVSDLFKTAGIASPIKGADIGPQREVVDVSGRVLGSCMGMTVADCKEPILRDAKTKAVIGGWYPFGKGRVFVSASVSLFSDQAAGYVLDVPEPKQHAVLNTLFDLLKERGQAGLTLR